jgi:hypothetical protein
MGLVAITWVKMGVEKCSSQYQKIWSERLVLIEYGW